MEMPVKPIPEKIDWILFEEGDILTIHERWIVLQDGIKTRERKDVFLFCCDLSSILSEDKPFNYFVVGSSV